MVRSHLAAVVLEGVHSFCRVSAKFSFQLFSGEAVFAPGISRNKSIKARWTAVACSMAERNAGGIYDTFRFGFMVFSSFQHRFIGAVQNGWPRTSLLKFLTRTG
jgi:hypothetical protein